MNLRILNPTDEPAVEAFLVRHPDHSLLLRSNIRSAGLRDRGEPHQGTYAAAEEEGRILAVAAHCGNGMVLLQAESADLLDEVVKLAVSRSARRVTGFLGPWDQVEAGRRALGLADTPAPTDSCDHLYTLDLDRMTIPDGLRSEGICCRASEDPDLPLLVQWRIEFCVEALGLPDTPDLRESCRDQIERSHTARDLWTLCQHDRPVSSLAFTARVPDAVVVGGVWTPRDRRGLGYARALVAGALEAQRALGVRRAVLFADPGNGSARSAYRAIGFELAGQFGFVQFAEPQEVLRA